MGGFCLFLMAVMRAYIFHLSQNSIKNFHEFQSLAEYPALNSPLLNYLRLKIPLAGKKVKKQLLSEISDSLAVH